MWDKTVELSGKKTAVIGTGASAMQLAPPIVDTVEIADHLPALPPMGGAVPEVPEEDPLSRPIPACGNSSYEWVVSPPPGLDLRQQGLRVAEGRPEWPHPERSLNTINDAHRRFVERYIRQQLGDRQDLADKVIPTFPAYVQSGCSCTRPGSARSGARTSS